MAEDYTIRRDQVSAGVLRQIKEAPEYDKDKVARGLGVARVAYLDGHPSIPSQFRGKHGILLMDGITLVFIMAETSDVYTIYLERIRRCDRLGLSGTCLLIGLKERDDFNIVSFAFMDTRVIDDWVQKINEPTSIRKP